MPNQWPQKLLKKLLSYLEAVTSITKMLIPNKGDRGWPHSVLPLSNSWKLIKIYKWWSRPALASWVLTISQYLITSAVCSERSWNISDNGLKIISNNYCQLPLSSFLYNSLTEFVAPNVCDKQKGIERALSGEPKLSEALTGKPEPLLGYTFASLTTAIAPGELSTVYAEEKLLGWVWATELSMENAVGCAGCWLRI